MSEYVPDKARYESMKYNRCGRSGLLLPALSLGLWHNFGYADSFENQREMLRFAFDSGITYFDLANNYGPPPGSAEENFGRIFKKDFRPYRDELIISTKAGYYMWEGPYGDRGSKKYLIASLDQSLKRMGLEYVDIFYHHRHDPDTPLEETMEALAQAVRQGKALYVGISNYGPEETKKAADILRQMGVKLLVHQPKYSMLDRRIEDGLLQVLEGEGVGVVVYSPLAQGLLTNRYLDGIPEDSRTMKSVFLKKENITEEIINKVRKLNEIAGKRGQSMAQMALSWVLRGGKVTSAIIGASRKEQIADNIKALDNLNFSEEELNEIDDILDS